MSVPAEPIMTRTTISSHMDASETAPGQPAIDDELRSLRSEVARLRALVGPSEKSYEDLERDARGARDAAAAAEFEAGRSRARIVELENEVRRWRRDFVWFRDLVVRRVPGLSARLRRLRRR